MQLLDCSSNGTYVNGKAVGKSRLLILSSGDELALLQVALLTDDARSEAERIYSASSRELMWSRIDELADTVGEGSEEDDEVSEASTEEGTVESADSE